MTDIEARFPSSATSAPPTEEMRSDSRAVHEAITGAAGFVAALVPAGRWQSLALTALEEALMWANKGIYNETREENSR